MAPCAPTPPDRADAATFRVQTSTKIEETHSKRLDETVVVGVRADEKPQGGIAGEDANSSPVESDANGEDRLRRMDLFELEAGVPRIAHPDEVGLASVSADGAGDRRGASEIA